MFFSLVEAERDRRWIIMMYEEPTAVFAYWHSAHHPTCNHLLHSRCSHFHLSTFHHVKKQERNYLSSNLSFRSHWRAVFGGFYGLFFCLIMFNRLHSPVFVRCCWFILVVIISSLLLSAHLIHHTENESLDHSGPHLLPCFMAFHPFLCSLELCSLSVAMLVLSRAEAETPDFFPAGNKQMFVRNNELLIDSM